MRKKSKRTLEDRDVEFYVRLEFEDDVMNDEFSLRNAIDRSILNLFGEIGRQTMEFEFVSFRYGTALIRTKTKYLSKIHSALAFYGIHEKKLCAFRIENKEEQEKDNEEDEETNSSTMNVD